MNNDRRLQLIMKKYEEGLNEDETRELEALREELDKMLTRDTHELDEMDEMERRIDKIWKRLSRDHE